MTPVLIALLLCTSPLSASAAADERACPVLWTYDSAEECRLVARSVRIADKGMRLECRALERGTDRASGAVTSTGSPFRQEAAR